MNNRYHVFNIYHEVTDYFKDKVLVICTRNVEKTPWGEAYGESVDFLYKDTPEYSDYFESIKDKDSEYLYANSDDFERKHLHIFRISETYLVHRSLREDTINQQEQIEPVDWGCPFIGPTIIGGRMKSMQMELSTCMMKSIVPYVILVGDNLQKQNLKN